MEASQLLAVNNFSINNKKISDDELEHAVAAYPMLEKYKLKSELAVLYSRDDFCKSEKIIDILNIINDNNLQSTFSETFKLLNILITTPMTTAEAERCFSTLKRIKTFLRCTMHNERLNALGMLTIENIMITEIKDFNEKVINHFATSKNRRLDLIFK